MHGWSGEEEYACWVRAVCAKIERRWRGCTRWRGIDGVPLGHFFVRGVGAGPPHNRWDRSVGGEIGELRRIDLRRE